MESPLCASDGSWYGRLECDYVVKCISGEVIVQTCTTVGSIDDVVNKGSLVRETKPGQVRSKEGLPMTTPRVSTGTLMGGYIDDVRQFHRRGGCTTNERETWPLSSTCGIMLS